jgi:hypothetical protein
MTYQHRARGRLMAGRYLMTLDWSGQASQCPRIWPFGLVQGQGQWLTGDRTWWPSFASSAGLSSPTP